MTFDAYLTDVLSRVHPGGYSARLRSSYKAWLKDFFIELQRYIPQLQQSHIEYIGQDATFFKCGCSAFTAPAGKIKSFHTIDDAEECDRVIAYPYTPGEFQAMVDDRFRCATDAEPATEYEAYGETYAYPTNLPLGLSYATPSIDRVVRSRERAFSVYNGYVWTWPVLNSDETGVLEWSGVKRSWRDSDEVSWKDENDDDDREIIALAELCLAWKSKLYIDCDEAGADTLKRLYDTAFAELKVDRKQIDVPEDIQPIRS